MVKQVSELTRDDFPYYCVVGTKLALVSNENISGHLNNGSIVLDSLSNYHVYIGYQLDFMSDDVEKSIDYKPSSIFETTLSGKIITPNDAGVGINWFKMSSAPRYVWLYVIKNDTPPKPTTTTSYTLTSYNNGTVTQSYSNLTRGSVISYTATPSSGYKTKSLELYRFNASSLSSIDFTQGTKIKDLDINNPSYTISDDDLGKCICVKAEFKKVFVLTDSFITNDLKNTSYKINGQTITLTANNGYEIKSAKLENHDIYDEPTWSLDFKDTNGVFKVRINDDKFNSTDINNLYITGSCGKKILTYTGSILDRDKKVKYTLNVDTITVTPNDNLKLNSLKGTLQPYPGGDVTNITGTIKNNVGTLVVPQDYLDNSSATLSLHYDFIKTIESLGLEDDTKKNAIVKITGDTITITPDAGFNIISAVFYIIDSYDFNHKKQNETNFKIENNIATLTLDNVQSISNTMVLHVSYKTEKQETITKYTGLAIKALDNTAINFNGVNQWTLTCNKDYHINSLHVDGAWIGTGVDNLKDIVTPTISKDKKSATFTVTNKDILTRANLVIKGDIAKDFTPPKPSSGTDIVRLYEVDDDTLEEITKKDFTFFESGHNVNYDFQSFINQLYKLPFSIPNSYLTTTSQIITGFFIVDAPAYKVNKQNYTLNVGSIVVPANNGFDYNIKDVSLILPWLPAVKISSSDILGKTISITYNLSLLDGTTTIVIKSDNVTIDSFKTNIAQNLEMFNIYANRENGNLNTTLQNDLRQAYIKVNYYKPIDNLISYPTNEHGTLKEYHGFIKVKNVILSKSINATIDYQIQTLLKEGVIINESKRN